MRGGTTSTPVAFHCWPPPPQCCPTVSTRWPLCHSAAMASTVPTTLLARAASGPEDDAGAEEKKFGCADVEEEEINILAQMLERANAKLAAAQAKAEVAARVAAAAGGELRMDLRPELGVEQLSFTEVPGSPAPDTSDAQLLGEAPAGGALLLELEARVREAQTAADLSRVPEEAVEEAASEGGEEEAAAAEAEGGSKEQSANGLAAIANAAADTPRLQSLQQTTRYLSRVKTACAPATYEMLSRRTPSARAVVSATRTSSGGRPSRGGSSPATAAKPVRTSASR